MTSDEAKKYLPVGLVAGAGTLTSTATLAQTTVPAVADVTTAINSTAAVAVAATSIVLGVMGVRIAIKLVNRLASKG